MDVIIPSPMNTPSYNRWATVPNLAFVTADGSFLCPDCANGKNGSIAHCNDHAEANDQWRIIGSQLVSEPVSCSHCGAVIQHTPQGNTAGRLRREYKKGVQ